MDSSDSSVTFRVRGQGAAALFKNEAGGHRWQRIPPNDTRPHSSTVTVAVLREPEGKPTAIPDSQIEITTTKGSGPGGQHKQKTETAVVVKHRPTGITVRCQSERSQVQNKANALEILQARVSELMAGQSKSKEDANRKKQVGTGMRADKIRTVQVRNSIVINHLTGRKCSLEKYLKGNIEAIA